MTKKTLTQSVEALTIVSSLDEARNTAVLSIVGGYGATRAYAKALNAFYPVNSQINAPQYWFDVEHTFTDDYSKIVNTEKKAFYKALNEAMKGTNPSVYWKRITTAGREELLGKDIKESVSGEAGDNEVNEGATGESNARSPRLRVTEESIKLYKFLARQENLDKELTSFMGFLIEGIEALGIKVSSIETK